MMKNQGNRYAQLSINLTPLGRINYDLSFLSLSSSSPSCSLPPRFQLCLESKFWKMNTSQAHIHINAPNCQLINGTMIRRIRRITAKNFLFLSWIILIYGLQRLRFLAAILLAQGFQGGVFSADAVTYAAICITVFHSFPDELTVFPEIFQIAGFW